MCSSRRNLPGQASGRKMSRPGGCRADAGCYFIMIFSGFSFTIGGSPFQLRRMGGLPQRVRSRGPSISLAGYTEDMPGSHRSGFLNADPRLCCPGRRHGAQEPVGFGSGWSAKRYRQFVAFRRPTWQSEESGLLSHYSFLANNPDEL